MNLQCYRKVRWATTVRALRLNYNNDNFHVNCNNNLNYNGYAVPMTQIGVRDFSFMKTHKNIYPYICSYKNLFLAYLKARKRKTSRPDIIEFEKNLDKNLLQLRQELLTNTYTPKPLKTFIIRDPKTRKISKSHFRDRVVHHALCNIIEPILEKTFIYDSYANRKGKGTLKAIERFDYFKRKVSDNLTKTAFVLKADIRHYFDEVDHNVLIDIIKKKIDDKDIILLIQKILSNHNSKISGKNMPLGNLTSQFFANVYLNELDHFVKCKLKIKYYIRYVDDFVIFHQSKEKLEEYKEKISLFLSEELLLELHPEKSKLIPLKQGTTFLGFRVFFNHKLISRKNLRNFKRKLYKMYINYNQKLIDYDSIYNFFEGWMAYCMNASTYRLRMRLFAYFETLFSNEVSTKEINRMIKIENQSIYPFRCIRTKKQA